MSSITTQEQFKELIHQVEVANNYKRPFAFAVGIATLSGSGEILEVYYPTPNFQKNFGSAAVLSKVIGRTSEAKTYTMSDTHLKEALECFQPFIGEPGHANVELLQQLTNSYEQLLKKNKQVVVCFLDEHSDPSSVADAYLRLHLLSHRFVKPHEISLKGIFSVLPNVAWTDEGAIAISEVSTRQLNRRLQGGMLLVHSVDKFPRMTDYVVPTGVRLCDAIRIRLGAHIGEGTTFMHEGFCNFNAGTEGPNMVEGRISAGVFVRKQTDIGGGASTMGTLSGGGTEIISVGAGCLLGANSGIGISLGNFCTVEAGLYVTAGTVVKLIESNEECKARELSGQDGLLFRRNSISGQVEVLKKHNLTELNAELHKN